MIINDKLVGVTKVLDTDVLNRECRINLVKLSNETIEKYCKSKAVETDRATTTTDLDVTDSEDNIPLSRLIVDLPSTGGESVYNRDHGHPRRKLKRIKYEESSPESASNTNHADHPKKLLKITPGSGPSTDRFRAHSMMKSKQKIKNLQQVTTLPAYKPNRKSWLQT